MALLKIWQVSRAIMRLLVIQFVCWLGWFSTFALAQSDISEGVTVSLNNFPTLGITCVGNLAVFVTSLIRGRIDLEMGARDVIDILCTRQLEKIKRIKHGYGLTTCTQRNAANEGGGDLPTASAEQVPQTASREESDVHAASRGTETASTEGNVNTSASTQRGGLQTASTAEIVLQIDSTEGEVGSENDEEAAAIRRLPTRKQGLERAAVIMLSNDTANWSMKQFMKSNAYVVQSIVLPFLPLKRALSDTKVKEELTSGVTIKSCKCKYRSSTCHCIVFWTMEEITNMLATRMPATLKLLSNSLCLLPCSTCLRKGCHECNRENLLRAEREADEGQPMRQRVVSDVLDNIRAGDIPAGKPIGICIPMSHARGDDWTKLLLKSLRSKDAEGRGVTNMATEALEGYLGGGRGSEEGSVEYDIFSFVVPRLTEVLINLVLTFWFRIDGFSSALLARRTVREYLVDTKSSGFAANAFLTEALVKSNGDNSQVCQVLTFRGSDWLCMITFISVGCVNVICALGWALLISFEFGPDSSNSPSLPIVAVIIAAIGSPWVVLMAALMVARATLHEIDNTVPSFVVRLSDFLGRAVLSRAALRFVVVFVGMFGVIVAFLVVVSVIVVFVVFSLVIWPGVLIARLLIKRRNQPYAYALIATGLLFEMACSVSWSALAGALGIKGFGRWLYGALQILIWVKWATGSLLLNGENSSEFFGFFRNSKSSEFFGRNPDRAILMFYSSSFWLNAVLAGVRCKWEAWPWQHNHLFSFVSQ